MRNPNPTSQRLTDNFERFNPYAARALELGENADVYGFLAIAFELSQLRYMLSKHDVDRAARARVGS